MTLNPALLVSSKEAARLLSISERTLWSLTDSGRLPCVKIGKAKRYSIPAIEKFIEQQTQPAPKPDTNQPIQGP